MSMLSFLREKASDRKLRLFAVACARQVGELTDERGRVAIATAERFADGKATPEELAACYRPARRIAIEWGREHPGEPLPYQLIAPADAASRCPFDAAHTGALDTGWTTVGGDWQSESVAYARLAELVRDVFGNPFRPVTADPAWLTPTTVTLAKQMYESRDFAMMSVLADALQDAGCDSADVLAHCRGDGPHARGCWVIDLLLGKT